MCHGSNSHLTEQAPVSSSIVHMNQTCQPNLVQFSRPCAEKKKKKKKAGEKIGKN